MKNDFENYIDLYSDTIPEIYDKIKCCLSEKELLTTKCFSK